MRQDLKFLREYFSIPKSAKVCWGLIEENLHHEEVAVRPGLIVAKRRNGNEKIYLDAEDIPDTASYYSLIIVKEPQEEAE